MEEVSEGQDCVEDRLTSLPRDLLHNILWLLGCTDACSCANKPSDVNKTFLSLRLCCKYMTKASDAARGCITLNPSHLTEAVPLLTQHTSIKSINLRSSTYLAQVFQSDVSLLSSLVPSLTTITLHSSSDGYVVVQDLQTLFLPWQHSLQRLELHRCIMTDNHHIFSPSWCPVLPSLTWLVLTQGAMKSLHLSGCLKLVHLEIADSMLLESIAFADTISLLFVVCVANFSLVGLDLSGCSNLQSLHCSSNLSLVTLALPSCIALHSLRLSKNRRLADQDLFWTTTPYLPSLCSLVMTESSTQCMDLGGCPKLVYLEVSNNAQLLTLTLPDTNSLQTVMCVDNTQLAVLDLSGCSDLQVLHCCLNNKLVNLALPSCLALTSLKMANNKVLEGVDLFQSTSSYLPSLCSLVMTHGFTQILNLEGCSKLEYLEVSNNVQLLTLTLPYINTLSTLLCISNTKLSALELSYCNKLQILDCCMNDRLLNLALPSCIALKSMKVTDNKLLATLDLFEGQTPYLPSLSSFVLKHSVLQYLDLQDCPRLSKLEVEDNQRLLCLRTAGMTSLETVSCVRNSQLTDLDMSGCSGLHTLHCKMNECVTTLALADCSALQSLLVTQNHSITTLGLSGCTALEKFGCWSNHSLSSLDLRSCSQLQTLILEHNRSLNSLLLQSKNKLQKLVCRSCKFASLNLSTCLCLQELELTSNGHLTIVNVSRLPALQKLQCQRNCSLLSVTAKGCPRLQDVTCTNLLSLQRLDMSECRALGSLVCRANHDLAQLDVTGCILLEVLHAKGSYKLLKVDVSSCPALTDTAGKWVQGLVADTMEKVDAAKSQCVPMPVVEKAHSCIIS